MAPDTVPLGQSNGNGDAQANGSRLATAQGAGVVGVANGMHKGAATALTTNGSANGDKSPAAAAVPSTYYGHNREEVTRILIQALSDMGYNSAAENVSRHSGYRLENPTVAAFRAAVLSGSWAQAEELLTGATVVDSSQDGSVGRDGVNNGNGLVLANGSDRDDMRFWLRQQKYLELLENQDTTDALHVLRNQLTPLHHDTKKLHFLSSLLMCASTQDLMDKARWDGAAGESRKKLLSELSRCISPSVMLPENRLAVLLQQVQQSQIDSCLYHTSASAPTLYSDHSCDRTNFPAEPALELPDLNGEVWKVQFSHDGSKLAACGSSEEVVIWDTRDFAVTNILQGHDQGVAQIAWSPDDTMLVTCARDKHARLWNANTGSLLRRFKKFEEPVSGAVWARDGHSFVLGSLDKSNGLSTFDIHSEQPVSWGARHRVQDLCGSPDGRWLVAADNIQKVHVYNGLTRDLEYELELASRPVSVAISQDSRHLLVNTTDSEAQIIDLLTRNTVQKFVDHKVGDYVICATFGGADESFVTSGSDDGNLFIWHGKTGATVERLPAHNMRCNGATWNPADPCMLASCSDDGPIKIWTNHSRAMELRQIYHGASSNGHRRIPRDAT